MRKILLTIALTITYFFLLKTYRNFYVADILYKRSQKVITEKKEKLAIKKANQAIQKNKWEPRYFLGRAKILLAATINKEEQERKTLKDLALNDMKKAIELNTNNLVTTKNLVFPYYILATNNLEIPAGGKNIDQNYILETKNFMSYIKQKYETDVGVFTLTAKYEKNLNLMEEFNESVKRVQILRPDLLEWHESFDISR